MNTDAPWPTLHEAETRVLEIQTKLHQWAITGPDRQFKDLYNLVYHPAVLIVAWHRVRGNRGSRSAGVDGVAPRQIAPGAGLFLLQLHVELKAGTFRPVPVRQRMIPKPNGKLRGLGIPTARDRTVQAALKLILEPVFEAGFQPCSYGFRPNRRAQDAIAEIHLLASKSYEWVLEGDIKACFDEISHPALMDRIRRRVGDKRVLALVKAFLKAGILTEAGARRNTNTGAPQGGILSPLLANIALSVLDDHFTQAWAWFSRYRGSRQHRRRRGLPNYKLIRYADDFVVMVAGTREHAEMLREEIAILLTAMGLRLAEEKTTVVHIDEGFEFLGFRIQRQIKQGTTNKKYVYTWPARKTLATVKATVRTITSQGTNKPLSDLLHQLNPVLRGWTNYFRYGASKKTFSYLSWFAWRRVISWLRRKYRHATWKQLRRRYLPGWWPAQGWTSLFNPATVPVTRYRYRGTAIPTPWHPATNKATT